MNEWEQFRIRPRTPLPDDVAELPEVYHIVHTRISRRILEDEQLRAGIIHDRSKLNKTRLAVNWFSANYWYPGSIYGTVRFSYDWKWLIKNRELYWVEAMDYPNPAYRLLVSDRDLSNSTKVTPYNPESDKGPVRLKDGKWFWNCRFTSEFMVEGDLSLKDATALSFVEHAKCRETRTCKEQQLRTATAAAQTLAFILGNDIHCVDHLIRKGKSLRSEADGFLVDLWCALGLKEDRFQGVLAKAKSTEDVLRGVLALYGSGQHDAAKEVLKTFKNQDVFTLALTSLIRTHFSVPTWEFAG